MLYIGGYILNSACFFADILTGRNPTFTHGGAGCHLEVTMESTGKQRKHRFLKAELAVLVCLACFWAFKSGAVDVDGVKAGVLRQVVKIAPDNIYAHRFLAHYYDYSDRYEEAIRAYKETVRIDPNDLDAQLNLAFACDSLGRFEEAAQAYREAIRIDPNDAGTQLHLAFTYQDLCRYEDSIKALKRLIEMEPDTVVLNVLLGRAYVKAGHPEEAILAYRHATSMDFDHAGAHRGLGEVYLRTGNMDLALEEYEILKTLDEELADELFSLISGRQTRKDVIYQGQDTPESIVDNYLQQGLQNIQNKYGLQWDEVNRRGPVLGQRKANQMFSDIDMRAKQEVQVLQQKVQQQMEQLQLIDRLAQQNPSINADDVKWRMVLGSELYNAMFSREKTPRSFGSSDR